MGLLSDGTGTLDAGAVTDLHCFATNLRQNCTETPRAPVASKSVTRSKRRAGPAPPTGRQLRAEERTDERALQRTAGNQAAVRVLQPAAADPNVTLGRGNISVDELEAYLATATVADGLRLRGNQALLRNLLQPASTCASRGGTSSAPTRRAGAAAWSPRSTRT